MKTIEELAEFFDAHGSVGFSPQRSGALKITVAIVKADPEDLNEFKSYFDRGRVGAYPTFPPHRYYSFFAYSTNAREILTALLPYLKKKRRVAHLAIEALTIQSSSTSRRSLEATKKLDLIRREVVSTREHRPGKDYTARV
ncbi:MAG TPA: hypothetical protein VFQ47_10060 [Nitrososphaera sp.]|nr:hypothetical protein [Nitrososphaera sp.]